MAQVTCHVIAPLSCEALEPGPPHLAQGLPSSLPDEAHYTNRTATSPVSLTNSSCRLTTWAPLTREHLSSFLGSRPFCHPTQSEARCGITEGAWTVSQNTGAGQLDTQGHEATPGFGFRAVWTQPRTQKSWWWGGDPQEAPMGLLGFLQMQSPYPGPQIGCHCLWILVTNATSRCPLWGGSEVEDWPLTQTLSSWQLPWHQVLGFHTMGWAEASPHCHLCPSV